jgi:hypothetical protein
MIEMVGEIAFLIWFLVIAGALSKTQKAHHVHKMSDAKGAIILLALFVIFGWMGGLFDDSSKVQECSKVDQIREEVIR